MGNFQILWVLAFLVTCGAVAEAWVCNGIHGPDEPPEANNGSTNFPYARCFSHLTPDHFTEENKQVIVSTKYRWPLGVIPLVFHESVPPGSYVEGIILASMKLIEESTCLRFVPRTQEENYITIQTHYDQGGCFSTGIGMRGGNQWINLQLGLCDFVDVSAHEILHAAGLYHEHARADRDEHITVNYENVCKEQRGNYKKCNETDSPADSCVTYGFDYNVRSIMHYTGRVFNRNFAVNPDVPIMIAKDSNNPIPDHNNQQLTAEDVGKINYMYNDCRGEPR